MSNLLDITMLSITHNVQPYEMEMLLRIVSGTALPNDYLQVGRLALFGILVDDKNKHFERFKGKSVVAFVSPGKLAYAIAHTAVMRCACGANTIYFSFAEQAFLEHHCKCAGNSYGAWYKPCK